MFTNMKCKISPCPKNYKEFVFNLKSGVKITAHYISSYSEVYAGIYKEKLTHIEFYGETISGNGFRSWFGGLNEYSDIEEAIVAVAEFLEKRTIEENPKILVQIQQQSLF